MCDRGDPVNDRGDWYLLQRTRERAQVNDQRNGGPSQVPKPASIIPAPLQPAQDSSQTRKPFV